MNKISFSMLYSSHFSEFASDWAWVVAAVLPLELKLSTGSELATVPDAISFSCVVILNESFFLVFYIQRKFYQSIACSKLADFPVLIALSL